MIWKWFYLSGKLNLYNSWEIHSQWHYQEYSKMDIVAFCRKPGIIIVKSQYKEIIYPIHKWNKHSIGIKHKIYLVAVENCWSMDGKMNVTNVVFSGPSFQ